MTRGSAAVLLRGTSQQRRPLTVFDSSKFYDVANDVDLYIQSYQASIFQKTMQKFMKLRLNFENGYADSNSQCLTDQITFPKIV